MPPETESWVGPEPPPDDPRRGRWGLARTLLERFGPRRGAEVLGELDLHLNDLSLSDHQRRVTYEVLEIAMLRQEDRGALSELVRSDRDAQIGSFREKLAQFREWYVRQWEDLEEYPTDLLEAVDRTRALLEKDSITSPSPIPDDHPQLRLHGITRRRGSPRKPEVAWALDHLQALHIGDEEDRRHLLRIVAVIESTDS